MFVVAAVTIPPIGLFYPETLRSLVGNGSISATGLNAAWWDLLTRRNHRFSEAQDNKAATQGGINVPAKQRINPVYLADVSRCGTNQLSIDFFSFSPCSTFAKKMCASCYSGMPSIMELSTLWYALRIHHDSRLSCSNPPWITRRTRALGSLWRALMGFRSPKPAFACWFLFFTSCA
jgi:hypothetical protein